MDDDQKFTLDSIIGEYRQALADAQLALATANAQIKIRDRQLAAERASH